MERIKYLRNLSLIVFSITGLLHIFSSILLANDLWKSQAYLINKVMDIPFLFTGAIYALTSLRIQLTDPFKEYKALDFAIFSLIVIILLGLITINLYFPDISNV